MYQVQYRYKGWALVYRENDWYSQRALNLVVNKNSSIGHLLVGRGYAATPQLCHSEVPLGFVPGPEEPVHVEVRHGLRRTNIGQWPLLLTGVVVLVYAITCDVTSHQSTVIVL